MVLVKSQNCTWLLTVAAHGLLIYIMNLRVHSVPLCLLESLGLWHPFQWLSSDVSFEKHAQGLRNKRGAVAERSLFLWKWLYGRFHLVLGTSLWDGEGNPPLWAGGVLQMGPGILLSTTKVARPTKGIPIKSTFRFVKSIVWFLQQQQQQQKTTSYTMSAKAAHSVACSSSSWVATHKISLSTLACLLMPSLFGSCLGSTQDFLSVASLTVLGDGDPQQSS